jgi:chloride channel protein, CIC family
MSHDPIAPSLKRGHTVGDTGKNRPEPWREFLRRMLLVAVTSTATWGLVTLTRWLCDCGFEAVMALFKSREAGGGWLLLLFALGVAGLLRGILARWNGWASAEGDGMAMALANFHLTYEDPDDHPGPRYWRPAMVRAL